MTDLLEERKRVYGSFEHNAILTQQLMGVIEDAEGVSNLSYVHLEAIHMIFHKISRMVCGDNLYPDNAVDIQGYAKRLEEWQRECLNEKL